MSALTPSSIPELIEAVRATPRLLAIGAGTKPRLSMVAYSIVTLKLERNEPPLLHKMEGRAGEEEASHAHAKPGTSPKETTLSPALSRSFVAGEGEESRRARAMADVVKLSTARLRGILEYEPGEFTFTALAGTPLREIAAELAKRGQYLPFDPPLVDAGATLGGTVAAGLSGPGRFRFGGVRDFILGVRFVDGLGRCLRMGGKVVKNAAGFDLPKFFVGSLGRFGVLAELTFKVFPAPPATLTLKLPVKDMDAATRLLTEAANSRWEPDALDLLPDGRHVCLRLAGPAPALPEIACEILARWPGEMLSADAANTIWSNLREFRWTHPEGPLLKIPLSPAALPPLFQKIHPLDGIRIHISAGGNVAYVSLPSTEGMTALSQQFLELNLPAMALRGNVPLWSGARPTFKLALSVKSALDPENRFPSLEEP